MSVATAARPQTTTYFGDALRRSIGYGEMLVKDIPADKFAHMPIPNLNHPAFCIGHLSLYPNRVLNMVGKSALIVDKPNYTALFVAGTPCVEQDGRYPAKDEIVAYYLDRYRAIEKVLPEISDEMLRRENPIEGRLRELFPTIGSAMCFLLNNHHMTHLGQVSAWRRVMGLGSVM